VRRLLQHWLYSNVITTRNALLRHTPGENPSKLSGSEWSGAAYPTEVTTARILSSSRLHFPHEQLVVSKVYKWWQLLVRDTTHIAAPAGTLCDTLRAPSATAPPTHVSLRSVLYFKKSHRGQMTPSDSEVGARGVTAVVYYKPPAPTRFEYNMCVKRGNISLRVFLRARAWHVNQGECARAASPRPPIHSYLSTALLLIGYQGNTWSSSSWVA